MLPNQIPGAVSRYKYTPRHQQQGDLSLNHPMPPPTQDDNPGPDNTNRDPPTPNTNQDHGRSDTE